MAEITEAIAQEEIADSLVAPIEPQPAQDTAAENEELESAETQPQESIEEDADWLPDEQEKVFPVETLAKFGARYGYTQEEIEADPRLQRTLHDKLNSDILIRQSQSQDLETEEQAQQLPFLPVQFDDHLSNLKQWAHQYTDPKMAQAFTDGFLQAFGVKDAATPETAMAVTETMTAFGMNLLNTALPQILGPMLEQAMPGMGSMYYQASRASSWDTVRNSDPQYEDLPAYGSKEFLAICKQLDKDYPSLTEMGHTLAQANGGELFGPRAEKFYSTLARLALKTQGSESPALVKQAFETGQNKAKHAAIRRQAGDLGAGKSKGLETMSKEDQDFWGEGLAIYRRQHGSL